GRVLHEYPLPAVGCPDADAVALGDARSQHTERERVDVGDEFGVAPALSDGGVDERLTVAEAGGGAVEVVADGVAEQRDIPGTLGVAGQAVDVEAGHRILL